MASGIQNNINNSSFAGVSASANETLDDFIITCVSMVCAGGPADISLTADLQLVSALTMTNAFTPSLPFQSFSEGGNDASATIVFTPGGNAAQSGTFSQCAGAG
jgi:hypothetical protein